MLCPGFSDLNDASSKTWSQLTNLIIVNIHSRSNPKHTSVASMLGILFTVLVSNTWLFIVELS